MNKLIQSSFNPDKISLTLKGFIPLIIFIGALAGIGITEAEMTNIITLIVGLTGTVGAVVTGIITLYGAIRRIGIKFHKGSKGNPEIEG